METGSRTSFRLGPYTCVERLGTGPLGDTFRAKVYGLGGVERHYALKRLHPRLAEDERFMVRLAALVKLQSQLTHAALGVGCELGEDGLQRWLVTEYVHGLDMRRFVDALAARRERLPPDVAALIVAEVAHAVSYAHGRTDLLSEGVVHGAITPRSILVTPDGTVRLSNVALLRALTDAAWIDRPEGEGYLPYFAPEVLQGEPAQRASDMWSLGAVLWELVAAGPPFPGRTAAELGSAIERGPIGTTRDPSLGQLAQRCLQNTPATRMQSAAELASALHEHLGSRAAQARSTLTALARRLISRRPTQSVPTVGPTGAPRAEVAQAGAAPTKAEFGRSSGGFWMPPVRTTPMPEPPSSGARTLQMPAVTPTGLNADAVTGPSAPRPAELPSAPAPGADDEFAAHAPHEGKNGHAAAASGAAGPSPPGDEFESPPATADREPPAVPSSAQPEFSFADLATEFDLAAPAQGQTSAAEDFGLASGRVAEADDFAPAPAALPAAAPAPPAPADPVAVADDFAPAVAAAHFEAPAPDEAPPPPSYDDDFAPAPPSAAPRAEARFEESAPPAVAFSDDFAEPPRPARSAPVETVAPAPPVAAPADDFAIPAAPVVAVPPGPERASLPARAAAPPVAAPPDESADDEDFLAPALGGVLIDHDLALPGVTVRPYAQAPASGAGTEQQVDERSRTRGKAENENKVTPPRGLPRVTAGGFAKSPAPSRQPAAPAGAKPEPASPRARAPVAAAPSAPPPAPAASEEPESFELSWDDDEVSTSPGVKSVTPPAISTGDFLPSAVEGSSAGHPPGEEEDSAIDDLVEVDPSLRELVSAARSADVDLPLMAAPQQLIKTTTSLSALSAALSESAEDPSAEASARRQRRDTGLRELSKSLQVKAKPDPKRIGRAVGAVVAVSVVLASGVVLWDQLTTALSAYRASHVPREVVSPRAVPAVTATLQIDSQPTASSLFIDGEPHGLTPGELTVTPGLHQVVVLGEGRAVWASAVEVPATGSTLTAPLKKAAHAPGKNANASFQIRCTTVGELRLFLDGADTGVNCPNRVPLAVSAGDHKIGLYSPRTGKTVTLERSVKASPLPTVVIVSY